MTSKFNLKQGIKKYYPLGFLFLIIFGFALIQEAKAKAISVGTASDNIGIGTDSPGTTYRLNVNGNSNITGTLNVTGGITGASLGSTLLNASNVSAGTFGSNSGGGNYAFPGLISTLAETDAGQTMLSSFQRTTTSRAGYKMHDGGQTKGLYIQDGINGGETGGIAIDNDGVTAFGAGDSGYVFRVVDEDFSSRTLMYISQAADTGVAGGLVGIGTTNPQVRLDVKGKFQVDNSGTYTNYSWAGGTLQTNSVEILDRVGGSTGDGVYPTLTFHDYGNGGAQFSMEGATATLHLGSGASGSAGTLAGSGSYFSKLKVWGAIESTGTISAASFSGPMSGTLNAANLSSGTFGSNTGGGNYSFPGAINVGAGVVSATEGSNTNPGSTAFQAREYNYGTTGISHIEQYAPRIGFHWGNRYWGQITYFNSVFNFRNSDLSGYAPIATGDISITDGNTKLQKGGGNALRVQTDSGYVDIGPQNSAWSHFQTDRNAFYFNKQISIDGNLCRYNGNCYSINDIATHRGEGTNFVDYSRYVYNNGAYSGSGWIEPSDLGVRYAGSAGNSDTLDGLHSGSFFQYEGFTLDANWMGRNRSGFTYSVGAPWTGPVVRFDSANYDLELNGTYSGGTALSYRIKNGDNDSWNSWYRIYSDAYRPYADVADNVVTPTSGYKHLGAWGVGRTDTGAILVNTAYRADYADAVDGQHFSWSNRSNGPTYVWAADSNGDSYLAYRPALSVDFANRSDKVNGVASNPDNSHPGSGLRPFYSWNTGQAFNSSAGYSNGISIGSHPGDTAYGFQIVQNMWDDNLYFRRYNGGWQTWYSVVYKDGSNNSTIGGTMTAGGFIYASDVKLKKNINTIDNSLAKIIQLRGVTFNWKKDNSPSVGLIAQEVEKVFPELVTEQNGIKAVQYGNLVAPLIEAVKEQQTEIQNQQNQINEMKAQIQSLQAKN